MAIETIEQLRAVVGPPHSAVAEKKSTHLTPEAKDFIERSPFLVLSTASSEGKLTHSPKGDDPDFVFVENDKTLLIPDRQGNRLIDGHLNVLQNPNMGLIFFVPNTTETLRVNGKAELVSDSNLLEKFATRDRPAVLITKILVEESFFHCGKALIRSQLWEPRFVASSRSDII
ncbi:MAG: pyridoxamine 5'-phosphate oxidase family protein [Halieaceae bacterium]|nr:pyridoxamine 5'-phosphate oxidase family protein [Halieaceae bacterium]